MQLMNIGILLLLAKLSKQCIRIQPIAENPILNNVIEALACSNIPKILDIIEKVANNIHIIRIIIGRISFLMM